MGQIFQIWNFLVIMIRVQAQILIWIQSISVFSYYNGDYQWMSRLYLSQGKRLSIDLNSIPYRVDDLWWNIYKPRVYSERPVDTVYSPASPFTGSFMDTAFQQAALSSSWALKMLPSTPKWNQMRSVWHTFLRWLHQEQPRPPRCRIKRWLPIGIPSTLH